MSQQEKLTLYGLKRKLEIQKPRTVEGLCQIASALALVSIACDLEIISTHISDISENIGSLSGDLDRIERTIRDRGE